MHPQGPAAVACRSPYLAVELRDRTGAVQGRAFRDAVKGALEHGLP